MELFVNVACLQLDCLPRQKESNLSKALTFAQQAVVKGANLLVLPELFTTSIVYSSREELYEDAEPIPGGATTRVLAEFCKSNAVYLTGSWIEQDGGKLYNTAALMGPEGYLGKYRKTHLCDEEFLWFEPGDLGYPVFHTKLGRIALLICLDSYYPETFRLCAMQQADIVCLPTNWAGRDAPGPYPTPGPVLCIAGALSNHLFVAAANRVGQAGTLSYPGCSILSGPTGAVEAQAQTRGEELVLARLNLAQARRKNIDCYNARLANRRTDLYDPWLGYRPETVDKP